MFSLSYICARTTYLQSLQNIPKYIKQNVSPPVKQMPDMYSGHQIS